MRSLRSTLIVTAILGFCLPLIAIPAYFHFHPPRGPIIPAKATAKEPSPTVIPTSTPQPTTIPTPTIAISDTKTYQDSDYNFKVSFPSTWSGVLNSKTNLGLETYTINSPTKSESLEILVSDGIWSNVKLEIGPGSKKTTFLNGPCLIRKNGKTTIYVFPSKNGSIIFRLSITGNSSQITKVFKSFKFI